MWKIRKRRLVESEDWWKTKITGKLRLVKNECRSPEGTKFRRMNGAKQKSSEKKQMWEQIKSCRKSKYGSETKVVLKANVGGKQKWGGETVRKVKHSSVRIENPIPALYRGTAYFSHARTFRTTWGGSKNNSGQKKTNEADPKGSASFNLCSSC